MYIPDVFNGVNILYYISSIVWSCRIRCGTKDLKWHSVHCCSTSRLSYLQPGWSIPAVTQSMWRSDSSPVSKITKRYVITKHHSITFQKYCYSVLHRRMFCHAAVDSCPSPRHSCTNTNIPSIMYDCNVWQRLDWHEGCIILLHYSYSWKPKRAKKKRIRWRTTNITGI